MLFPSATLLFLLSSAQSVSAYSTVCALGSIAAQRKLDKLDREQDQTPRPQQQLRHVLTDSPASSFGSAALERVQGLAATVAKDPPASQEPPQREASFQRRVNIHTREGPGVSLRPEAMWAEEEQVWTALENLERDMQFLDRLVVEKPQLSPLELTLLSVSVMAAGAGPLVLDGQITSFLAPSAAAFSAAIGIGAEYVGKVAVADSKEVAAATIQCAAESEGLLANAERAKAVTPLCVGIGATAASFALLVPVLLNSLALAQNVQLVTEIYLCCPLIAILSTAVSALALAETKSFCRRATSIGNRRFARSGLVGRTWMSLTEQVEMKSTGSSTKWQTFAASVVPAPLVGCFIPGTLPSKTIIATALAAAQTAYYLMQAELELSRATDAVALKSRSAAVCDTYANQGARSAAILPFTSALSSLCAAATAAIVELPFIESLAHMGSLGVAGQVCCVATFPTMAALFSAAAAVSKARCEVDAEATTQAATTLALEYSDSTSNATEDPILKPFRGVLELIRLTGLSNVWQPLKRRFQSYWFVRATSNFFKKWNNSTPSTPTEGDAAIA